MPTVITHGLIGYAASRLSSAPADSRVGLVRAAVVVSVLPDVDALFMRWIPYGATFGHRGFSHSLTFALLVGLAATAVCWRWRRWFPGGAAGLGAMLVLVAASHGFLDSLTDGGLGIALLSPFSNRRYFMAWRPIPVAPINPVAFLAMPWALKALLVEALMFWPAAMVVPVLRSGLKSPWRIAAAMCLGALSIATWLARL